MSDGNNKRGEGNRSRRRRNNNNDRRSSQNMTPRFTAIAVRSPGQQSEMPTTIESRHRLFDPNTNDKSVSSTTNKKQLYRVISHDNTNTTNTTNTNSNNRNLYKHADNNNLESRQHVYSSLRNMTSKQQRYNSETSNNTIAEATGSSSSRSISIKEQQQRHPQQASSSNTNMNNISGNNINSTSNGSSRFIRENEGKSSDRTTGSERRNSSPTAYSAADGVLEYKLGTKINSMSGNKADSVNNATGTNGKALAGINNTPTSKSKRARCIYVVIDALSLIEEFENIKWIQSNLVEFRCVLAAAVIRDLEKLRKTKILEDHATKAVKVFQFLKWNRIDKKDPNSNNNNENGNENGNENDNKNENDKQQQWLIFQTAQDRDKCNKMFINGRAETTDDEVLACTLDIKHKISTWEPFNPELTILTSSENLLSKAFVENISSESAKSFVKRWGKKVSLKSTRSAGSEMGFL